MPAQKTWTQLLGENGRDVHVDGTLIVRQIRGEEHRVLWRFDTRRQAVEAYFSWMTEQRLPSARNLEDQEETQNAG